MRKSVLDANSVKANVNSTIPLSITFRFKFHQRQVSMTITLLQGPHTQNARINSSLPLHRNKQKPLAFAFPIYDMSDDGQVNFFSQSIS